MRRIELKSYVDYGSFLLVATLFTLVLKIALKVGVEFFWFDAITIPLIFIFWALSRFLRISKRRRQKE